jgi:hypothetical protein
MNNSPNNPSSNCLGPGVNESDIVTAIGKSGYPLQTVVANILRSDFHVQDEWSYVDRNSKQLRTIDIFAQKYLYDITAEQPHVRPFLNLIIECKQSSLPYVFFLSPSKPWLPEFPLLAGLTGKMVEITSDDTPSSFTLPMLHALGMDSHKFVQDTDFCMVFSQCVRKGSGLDLSGSDSYNNLVLPLVNCLQHFQLAEAPPSTALYFDAHLTVGIALLDAPMIGVRVNSQHHEYVFTPWVRIIRHEYQEDSYYPSKGIMAAIDVVHKDFFGTYLNDNLLPYANSFCERAIKHQKVVASGKAFVLGMEHDCANDICSRLRPRNTKARISRIKASFKNIFHILTGKKVS